MWSVNGTISECRVKRHGCERKIGSCRLVRIFGTVGSLHDWPWHLAIGRALASLSLLLCHIATVRPTAASTRTMVAQIAWSICIRRHLDLWSALWRTRVPDLAVQIAPWIGSGPHGRFCMAHSQRLPALLHRRRVQPCRYLDHPLDHRLDIAGLSRVPPNPFSKTCCVADESNSD